MAVEILIITGHFGSGKTEYALSLAYALKARGEKVVIVDFDIVNPYFRTNDVKARLKEDGIGIIAPRFAGTNVDLPSLPAEIYSVFELSDYKIIFDVGGDDEGAIALGRYRSYFEQSGYTMEMVVNTRRPQTANPEDIALMAKAIEYACGLKVSGLVNCTNLSYETTVGDIMASLPLVSTAAELLGVPVKKVCARRDLVEEMQCLSGISITPIDLRLPAY